MCPRCFQKIAEKSNNYWFYLPNLLTFYDNISNKLLRPSQFLEKLIEILKWSILQKWIRSPSQCWACWKNSKTEACARKLPQILANNIDHGGRGISLRIYVWYCGCKISNFLQFKIHNKQNSYFYVSNFKMFLFYIGIIWKNGSVWI